MSDPVPCRAQLLETLGTLLGGITGETGLIVDIDPRQPPEKTPTIVVRSGAETPTPDFTGEDAFTLAVDLEFYAEGQGDDADKDARAKLDRLRAKAIAIVAADPTLGGLARRVEPRDETAPAYTPVAGHPDIRATSRGYEIDYATKEGDPFAFA